MPGPPPKAALPRVNSQQSILQRKTSNTSTPRSYSPAPSAMLLPGRHTPSPLPSATLMGKRESLVRNKASNSSMNLLNVSTPDLVPNDSASTHNGVGGRLSTLEEDEMSLAERRAIIQQQRHSQSLLPRQNSQTFDSHQPNRDGRAHDRQRQENMLAQWRHSIQKDLVATQDPEVIAADEQRAKLLQDKQQQRQSQQQAAMYHKSRDSAFDEMMRRGDMLDLHREAMRKMQANANRHV